jgi:hypothetical protein
VAAEIYALGWFAPYDEPPDGPMGRLRMMNTGLLEWDGDRKRSYEAFKRG